MSSQVIQIWALASLNVNRMLGFVLLLFLFVPPLVTYTSGEKIAQKEALLSSFTEVFLEVKHMKTL